MADIDLFSTALLTVPAKGAMMVSGSASPFAEMNLVLFKNAITPGENSTWADFVWADFDGYAPVVLGVPSSWFIDSDGLVKVRFPSVVFACTGPGTNNTIYGWGFTNTADDVWVGGNLFPTPYNITTAGQGIPVDPILVYGQ